MKKLLFFLIICLYSISVYSQNPQGFNYQAVARDAGGHSITNTPMPVRLSILDVDSTTIIWQELHSLVVTNSFGLINVVLGRGSRVSGVAKFSDIDWSIGPKFIETEIFYPSSFVSMGYTRIWSVPYSMISTGISPGTRLEITSSDDESTEALFEVKRKDGQTVFAVYNDAVNVYIPEQASKKKKGGFAVGGYGASKGLFSQEYLTVTPDSIRFYIDDLPGKGGAAKGGFAVGGFDQNKTNPNQYLSILGASIVETIPAKGSIALGMFSKAQADYSTSLGYFSRAIMPYSTAIGYHAFASGPYSYAIGSNAEANGGNSFAIGSYGLNENGSRDTTRATWTPGYYSLAFGMGAQATKVGAMSLGVNTTASGDQSLSIGFGTNATSQFATAMGYKASANGFKSIAIGAHYHLTFDKLVWEWSEALGKWIITTVPTPIDKGTSADGDYSIAIGNGNFSNNGGLTLGTNNNATAFGSVAIGHSNEALSDFSFVAGFGNYVDGLKSFALGENLIGKAANSFVIGAYNKIEGTVNGWLDKEPLFVIGNGNPGVRSNAFAVLKDGNIVLSPNIVPGASGLQLVYDPADNLMKKIVSSSRYKTNISPLNSVTWLYDLNPVSFQYLSDSEKKTQYGLIAEDIEAVNKDLVIYLDGKPEGINYNSLFAPMIKALQDQKLIIDQLNTKNSYLTGENEELKARLDKLEKVVGAIASQQK